MEIITNPDSFMERNKDVGFATPLSIVVAYGIIGAIRASFSAPLMAEFVKNLLVEQGFSGQQAEMLSRTTYYSSIVTPLIMPIAGWLMITVLLYVISSFFNAKGDFKTLLKLTSFSFIPAILVSPVSIYFTHSYAKMLATYGIEGIKTLNTYTVSQTLLGIAVLFWQFLYWTFAVKNSRGLNLRRAAIVSSIPLAIMLVFNLSSLILLMTPGRIY